MAFISLAVLSGMMAEGVAQLASDVKDVQVTFQNTSKAALALSLVDQNGKETVHVPSLAAGSQVSINSRPGNLWLAKLDGEEFAEYRVDASEEQEVDLALEATWKLPVEVVLQNDSDDPVSLWLIKEDDEPVELCAELDPGQQWEQPGLATGSFLQVKRADEVLAEYLTDNVPSQVLPLSELTEAYSKSVSVTFQNTTTDAVDIGWLHPDGGIRITHPQLPAEQQVVQSCLPGHRWVILQAGELIGNFLAGSKSDQTVDIGELAEQSLQANDAIAAGRAIPANDDAKVEPALPSRQPKVVASNPTSGNNRNNPPPTGRKPAAPPANIAPSNNDPDAPPPSVRTNPPPNNPSPKSQPVPEPEAPQFALDSLVGRYKRLPIESGWHDVIITRTEDAGVLVWQNREGKSWWLYGEDNNPVLSTDETNPYFNQNPPHRTVEVEFVRDRSGNPTSKIKGLNFQKDKDGVYDLYIKVSDSTRPD